LAQTFGEPVKKGPLAFENLRMSGGQIKPFGTVDFRKGLRLSTLGRPLDFEGVAFYGLNVEVAFDSEAKDTFAATLANLAKWFKRSGESHARLLRELSDGSDTGVLACIHFAFRD
jgi:hypothetical protein